jgi:homeobox-leucine zipper protein
LQPNLLDNPQLQQALQQQHLLDQIPATTAESGDDMMMRGGRGGSDPLGDEFESKSGSENVDGVSVDDQDPNQRPSKKKRYHRHTQHQIQELEA